MKKLYFLLFICSLIANTTLLAQFNDYTAKFGIRGNGLLPDTEFDKDLKPTDADFKFSFSGEAFVRFELFTQVLETEIGGERMLEELEDDPLPRIC